MIGIFDSGVGGLCAFREVRRLIPREDILYLADRKNSPYGTKSKEEIIALTRADIQRLRSMGARKILIACCTASSIHDRLSESEREIAMPIITPAAKRAAALGRKIAVIATRHTAEGGFFSREIAKFSDAIVTELAEQKLVSLVEGGSRDGRIGDECKRELKKIKDKVREINADVLILGCTHFSHLEGELSRLLPTVKIISPAREGAVALVRSMNTCRVEGGRVTYM